MSRGTKHRSIRVEDALWDPAKARADAEGVNLSEVIREALVEYVREGEDAPEVEEEIMAR